MREALASLELLVVIDVAMTETARLADYVLLRRRSTRSGKATFFNFEFPANVFHLRRPVLSAPEGVLPEPEIHARLVEALGALSEADLAPLRAAAERQQGRVRRGLLRRHRRQPGPRQRSRPIVLYRTLGPTLPDGAAAAAILWGAAHRCALGFPESVRRAGFTGEGLEAGEQLFDAVLSSPPGSPSPSTSTRTAGVASAPRTAASTWPSPSCSTSWPPWPSRLSADPAFPFVLSAGERRSFTANTIFRDPTWRKRDAEGALRLNRADAERLGVADGGRARLTTKRASLEVVVELSDLMQPGHISLPNGLGVDYPGEDGAVSAGVAPERAHRRRGPGLAGRHAVAQARAGAPRTHRLGRAP